MALEDRIDKLIAAVEANTAALLAGGKAPAKGAAAAKDKPAKDKVTSKYTADQVRDALIKVKSEVGEDEAKRIISEVGGYEKLAQLVADPSKFDAVMEAVETAIAEAESGGGEDDGGL